MIIIKIVYLSLAYPILQLYYSVKKLEIMRCIGAQNNLPL